MNRMLVFIAGVAATLSAGALYHGPLGTADRLTGRIEQTARLTLDHYEMNGIQARVERGPLTRRLVLSGAADNFQRAELVRILSEIPGVGEVRWDPASLPLEGGAA